MRRPAIEDLIRSLYPEPRIDSVSHFGADAADGDHEATEKGIGYGKPVRVRGADKGGASFDVVIHTATSDVFGHDRRADRAAEMLLAYDTFAAIPHHADALDVGAVADDHRFVSLRGCGEFYLVSRYCDGAPYAEDLRAIAHSGEASERDIERARALADYLADLHAEPVDNPIGYRRAIRDLIGHGEGIFGIVDGYPDDTEPQLLERIRDIERRAAEWRWKLRGRERRCRRTHGDFHPFNVLFTPAGEIALLDAARGCLGDPADDVVCMAINYPFFAIASPGSWAGAFEKLWTSYWDRYLQRAGDRELLEVGPPFMAWRLLVVANPRWYPAMGDEQRGKLLAVAEAALDRGEVPLDLEGLID